MLVKDKLGNYEEVFPKISRWCSEGHWEVYGSDGEISVFRPDDRMKIFEGKNSRFFVVCPAADGQLRCPICGQTSVGIHRFCCSACGASCGTVNGCGSDSCVESIQEERKVIIKDDKFMTVEQALSLLLDFVKSAEKHDRKLEVACDVVEDFIVNHLGEE